jgi:hypothetical protein
MATRDELVMALSERYLQSDRIERGRILDEFAAVTGFHRKHAMRLLRGGSPGQQSASRPGRRIYDDAARDGSPNGIWVRIELSRCIRPAPLHFRGRRTPPPP